MSKPATSTAPKIDKLCDDVSFDHASSLLHKGLQDGQRYFGRGMSIFPRFIYFILRGCIYILKSNWQPISAIF